MQDIRRISEYLDSKYKLPFGWRIGWDGILGFIPGFGDAVTNVLSFYIVIRAAMLGCPPAVIIRMGINILIDNVLDVIPFLGNIFDFVWKANNKNILLLENYQTHPRQVTVASRVVVVITLLVLLGMMIGLFILAFWVAQWLWSQFDQPTWTV